MSNLPILPIGVPPLDGNGNFTQPWYNYLNRSGGSETSYNVLDYGAKGDGTTDDTAAIQSALDSGVAWIYFPSGTFLSGPLTIPSTIKLLSGPGTLQLHGTVAAFGTFLLSNSSSNLRIDGLTLTAATPTYDTVNMIALLSAFEVRITNCVFSRGRFGVYLGTGSSDVTIENNWFNAQIQSAVVAIEGGVTNINVLNNRVASGVPGGTGHQIAIGLEAGSGSTDCNVIGNLIYGGQGFGIHYETVTRGVIAHNTIRDTAFEAITVLGDHVHINNNVCYWSTAGTDVGMSFTGTTANTVRGLTISDNLIWHSYKGGIFLAGYIDRCIVESNRILDCNRSAGVSAPAGITLSGTNTLRNTVIHNVADNTVAGAVNYVVQETTPADYTFAGYNYGRSMTAGQVSLTGVNSVTTGSNALPT